MVRSLLICSIGCLLASGLAQAEPDATEALRLFKSYQNQARNSNASRLISRITKALEIHPVVTREEIGNKPPVLTFVLFSRTHFNPSQKSYSEVSAEVLRLIAAGAFDRHNYQLNDLHPDQARQTIWQLALDDVAMRVENVPGNAITIVFFAVDNLRSGLHAVRHTLIPPRNPGS